LVITGHSSSTSGDGDISEGDYFLISSDDDDHSFLFRLTSAEYKDSEGTFVIEDVGGSADPITITTGALTATAVDQSRPIRIHGNDYTFAARYVSATDTPYLALATAQNKIYLSNEQSISLSTTGDVGDPQDTSASPRTVKAVLDKSADLTDNLLDSDVTLTFSGTVSRSSDDTGGSSLSLAVTNSNALLEGSPENPESDDLHTGYTSFGTFITLDDSDSDGDVVTLTTPDKQIRPLVVLEGAAGASSVVSTGDSGTTSVTQARPASSVGNYQDFNTILVGGPCVNPFAAQALGSSGECTDGFKDGSAIIQYVPHTNGNVALVVAGYSASDTTRAVNVLTQSTRDEGLTGTKVTVTPNPSGSGVVVSPAQ